VKVEDVFVAGLGTYLPEVADAAEAVALGRYDAEEHRRGGWTGAAVAGDVPAVDMAVQAAGRALERSGHAPGEIDLLLYAAFFHQGPDGWSPHHYVQSRTVGGTAPALRVEQGCNAMLAAMELATCYLGVPGRTAALIAGADNVGVPLVDRWNYLAGANSNRGSILGDAGSAVVLSRRGGFARLLAVGSGSLPHLEAMHRGDADLFPPAATVGLPMELGRRIAEFARRHPQEWALAKKELQAARTELAVRTLEEAGIGPADVTRVTHVFTGGIEYLRSLLDPLGIDPRRGLLEFGRGLGHLGVNDQVTGLTHLVETRAVGPGDHVLMLSNGSGVALACAVVEITEPVDW
jgi:3-oxoacyl-[acyl-carrier-protein] synthase-3